jgi:uncharacterized Zn finger protein
MRSRFRSFGRRDEYNSHRYGGFAPYVSVAQRRANARKEMAQLQKNGTAIEPVEIKGRTIATTFWGKGWCDHIEGFRDYDNRLPRGRTYVRNGSVCHLAISKGLVEAHVSGSELYHVRVTIGPLSANKWRDLKRSAAGKIASLLSLLRGDLSTDVMELVVDRTTGLFPLSGEIKFHCSCPDSASMCKHIAAVLYGVGSRLDAKPESLFLLRGVDHLELIQVDAEAAVSAATSGSARNRIRDEDLASVFGVDFAIDETPESPTPKVTRGKRSAKEKVPARTKPKARQGGTRRSPKLATTASKPAGKKTVKPKAVAKSTPKLAVKK